MFGVGWRKKSHTQTILDSSRTGVEQMRETLPDATNLTGAFLDLASRFGIDLSELAEQAADRLGEVASRASEGAHELARSDAARQARQFTIQAREHAAEGARELARSDAGRQARSITRQARTHAAELVSRAGAEGLAAAIAPPRRRSRLPLALGLLATIGAGAALYWFFLKPPSEPSTEETESQDTASTAPAPSPQPPMGTRAKNPAQSAMDAVRRRYELARREGTATQEATERDLWRQYDEDVREANQSQSFSNGHGSEPSAR